MGLAVTTTGTIKASQIALAGLSGILAFAVIGTAAHTYSVFHSQRDQYNPWFLPLWPEHFDLTGTKAAIGTASAIALLNVGLLVVTLVPKINSNRPALGALSAVSVSISSIFLAVASVVTSRLLDNRAENSDTIKTWTCRFRNDTPENGLGSLPGNLSNSQFNKICKESMFDFWGMIAIIILQVFILTSTIAQWFLNKRSPPSPPASSFDSVHGKGDGW